MLKQRTLSFEHIFTVSFQDFVDETDLLLTKIVIPLIPHFMKKLSSAIHYIKGA